MTLQFRRAPTQFSLGCHPFRHNPNTQTSIETHKPFYSMFRASTTITINMIFINRKRYKTKTLFVFSNVSVIFDQNSFCYWIPVSNIVTKKKFCLMRKCMRHIFLSRCLNVSLLLNLHSVVYQTFYLMLRLNLCKYTSPKKLSQTVETLHSSRVKLRIVPFPSVL